MKIPKIVYIFNNAGDMQVHRIPGYIHSIENYVPYLTGILKEAFNEEAKSCIIEGEYFEKKRPEFPYKIF